MTMVTTSRVPQFWWKALVTLGAICLYAIGSQIPLPGVNVEVFDDGGFRGGAQRLSLFALGVTPIFSVALLLEFFKSIVPPFGRWANANGARLRVYLVLGALALAAVQAGGVARAMEDLRGLVDEPGPMFRATIVVTLVGATVVLAWLSERITLSGLGKGLWIFLLAPILLGLPALVAGSYELLRGGDVAAWPIVASLAFLVVASVLLAGFAKDRNHAENGGLPIDVWPALLAIYIADPLMVVIGWLAGSDAETLRRVLEVGHPLRLVLLSLLIAGFAILRSSLWPRAPGARARTWAFASLQIVICVIGEMLTRWTDVPFNVSGPWFIVVAAVGLDILAEARAAPAKLEDPAPVGTIRLSGAPPDR
jgi:preprotein translocase subunit SecY